MPAASVALAFDSALGGGTSSTITGPPTVAQGDLLICFILADDTQTALLGSTTGEPTWGNGGGATWNVLHSGTAKSTGGDASGYAAWKIANAGDIASGTGKNYTLTWSAGAEGSATFIRVPAGEYDSGTPIDASSVATTGAGAASITLPGVTTTAVDARLVAWAGVDESNATYDPYWAEPPVAGWTSLLGTSGTSSGQGGSNTYVGVATATQASAGASGDKTFTARVENDAIVGFLVSIKAAAGGGSSGTFTTATGDATADGATGALAASSTLVTETGDATADGAAGALASSSTLTTASSDATADGGSATFAGAATFATVSANAVADGGAGAFQAGGSATLPTNTGDAAADGGAGAFTATSTLATATASATADGGVSDFTASATLSTQPGSATADGGAGAFTAGETIPRLIRRALSASLTQKQLSAVEPLHRSLSPAAGRRTLTPVED